MDTATVSQIHQIMLIPSRVGMVLMRAVGIAGIVGGEHGHVRADTRDVVIESAHFDPVLLRRTATRLGLKTDAVYRFERGVDPLLAPKAAVRVAELLRAAGGTPEAGQTVVGTPEVPQTITTTGEPGDSCHHDGR